MPYAGGPLTTVWADKDIFHRRLAERLRELDILRDTNGVSGWE
ncbi:hypothetical protein [Sorangium sp. So ce363]